VLKSEARIGRHDERFFLLPTNQLLRPWGEQSMIAGRPVDFAFDSQKRLLAVLNSRQRQPDGWRDRTPVRRSSRDPHLTPASRTGLVTVNCGPAKPHTDRARQPSDRADFESGTPGKTDHIELKPHPVPAGMAFSSDGKKAYVAFSRNNSLAVVDAETCKVEREIEVGMAPFAVVVSGKQGKIFVSNRGGRRPAPGDTKAPSSGSDIVTDPVTGASTTGTVSVIDSQTLAVKEIAVGLAPSGMALSPDEKSLAVANGHSDSISILDTANLTRSDLRIRTWPERPDRQSTCRSRFRAGWEDHLRRLRRETMRSRSLPPKGRAGR